MTESACRRAWLIKVIVAAGLLAMAGCASLKAPTEQSIAGLSPSGTVSVTEDFVTGVELV